MATTRVPAESPSAERKADAVPWRRLIEDRLVAPLAARAGQRPDEVAALFLTGSYARGSWNARRPNVNLYFVACDGAAPALRCDLGRTFSGIRSDLRARGVEFVVDCHPFTISQRDPDRLENPTLTLTTKVLDGEHRASRYRIASTIGHGWWRTHRMLVGEEAVLSPFVMPPERDREWLLGVHQALSHYRNILDHLPWAIDGVRSPRALLEESCRYAEEALRDGVHIGVTDAELARGRHVEVLHDWAEAGVPFYRERYGEDGVRACAAVARLKEAVVAPVVEVATAEAAWSDALSVWSTAWSGYRRLAAVADLEPALQRVTAWL